MKRISRFVFGALLGGLIGGSIIILFTPESGDNTRAAISSRLKNLAYEIRTAVLERKEELKKEIENYKNSAF